MIRVVAVAFCYIVLNAQCNAQKNCKSSAECGNGQTSACVAVTSPDHSTGVCECLFGFGLEVDESGNCKPAVTTAATPAGGSSPALAAESATPTSAPVSGTSADGSSPPSGAESATPTSAGQTTAGATSAPQPGTPAANSPTSGTGNSTLNNTETPCPRLYGIKETNPVCLHGGQCVDYNDTLSFCVCVGSRAGPNCGVDLRPKSLDNKTLSTIIIKENTIYDYKRRFDGSTVGRLYANSIQDCVQACGSAQPDKYCKSVNFGTYDKVKQSVCELLAVNAVTDSYISSYLVQKQGWSYAYLP